jgi:hypothetical protein
VACKGERHGLIWRWVLWVRVCACVFFLFSLLSSSCMCELNPRMRWRFMSGTLPTMREPFMTKGPIFGKEVYVFLLICIDYSRKVTHLFLRSSWNWAHQSIHVLETFSPECCSPACTLSSL